MRMLDPVHAGPTPEPHILAADQLPDLRVRRNRVIVLDEGHTVVWPALHHGEHPFVHGHGHGRAPVWMITTEGTERERGFGPMCLDGLVVESSSRRSDRAR